MLAWHFDRSEFTTTLLLQAYEQGGQFEYVKDLRTAGKPNHEGVARLLAGQTAVSRPSLEPGTLNVFRGSNTAHRVTEISGDRARVVSVFSFFEKPGVVFNDEERLGCYGWTL